MNRNSFLLSVSLWTGGLLLLSASHQLLAGLLSEDPGAWTNVVFLLPGWAGVLLPFCAFAGGVAAGRSLQFPALARRAAGVAVLSYFLLAFGAPLAVYTERSLAGSDLASFYPTGPTTPKGLWELRSALPPQSPEGYSFGVEEPLNLPPNWVTYLLASPVVLALYTLLSAFLGLISAEVTVGLSPPGRRNARWALGLLFGIAFFLLEGWAADWVRSDPAHSGFLAAWSPALIPFVVALLLHRLAKRGRSRG